MEDEASVRDLVAVTLKLQGYTVLLARDGEEALEVFDRDSVVVDLVITDVRMPRLGGIELHHRVQSNRPSLRFIFMTDYGETTVEGALPGYKDQPLLYKPFSIRDLV